MGVSSIIRKNEGRKRGRGSEEVRERQREREER